MFHVGGKFGSGFTVWNSRGGRLRLALNRNYDPTHHDLLFASDPWSPLLSNLLYLQDEKHLLQRSLHSEQVFRNSHPLRNRYGLPLIRWRALGPDSRLLWTKTNEGGSLDDLQGNSQMDKRDPVVMQAIANVIGAQTIDMGCLGPPPGQTQAIYDEIKRLDRARLEAEHRRTVEIQPNLKTDNDADALFTSISMTRSINGRSMRLASSDRDGRCREATTPVVPGPMTSLNCSSPACSPAKPSRHHRQPVSTA
jgi:hypothetical protein